MYYTLISFPAGIVIEGVIASRTRNRMRVVAPGLADAFELKRSGNGWLTEDGKEVHLEFMATDTDTDMVAGSGERAVVAQVGAAGAI